MKYTGWELKFFDKSYNFRKYQFDLIKSFIGKKVLEIGPGTGEFAETYLTNKVKKLTLSEINYSLRNKLKKKFKSKKNVKILSKKINEIKNKFDTIFYFDVLEHIKDHKLEILTAIKKLKKNGHLVIFVPANNFLYSNYDKSIGHYRRYGKQFFFNFTKKHNLKCKKLIYIDSIGFLFLLINKMINPRNKKNVGVATLIWNFLVPLSRFIDKLIFNKFGKSLLCIIKI